MKSIFLSLLATAAAFLASGCASSDPSSSGGTVPMPPQVQVPVETALRPVERALLPEFEEALRDAGYMPVKTPAEYLADFKIEEGPINADTSMTLLRQGQKVAYATSRSGSWNKLFKGSSVAQQSFFRCLKDFEGRIPPGMTGYRQNGGLQPQYQGNGYQGAAEPSWKTGW